MKRRTDTADNSRQRPGYWLADFGISGGREEHDRAGDAFGR